MAGLEIPTCTDEEILNELRELGYEDVSPELFQMMKKDLSELISQENSVSMNTTNRSYDRFDFKNKKSSKFLNSNNTLRVCAPLRDLNTNLYSTTSDGRKRIVKKIENLDFIKTKPFQVTSNESEIRKLSSLQHRFSDSELYASFLQNNLPANSENSPCLNRSVSSISLSGISKYGGNKSSQSGKESESNSFASKERFMPVRQLSVVKELEVNSNENMHLNTSAKIHRSAEVIMPIASKNLPKDHKLSNKSKFCKNDSPRFQSLNSSSDLELSLSSLSISGKLKRKTMKHKAGIQFITEEFVNTPSIFSSSYPNTLNSSKSFSNNDLSFKTNSSSGSLVALSPDYSFSPRSDFSLPTKTHSIKPHRKKHDPVAMYNYYKKYWDNFKPPGEKTHDKLRWAVRDKMLDYSL